MGVADLDKLVKKIIQKLFKLEEQLCAINFKITAKIFEHFYQFVFFGWLNFVKIHNKDETLSQKYAK
jgi:hypothetical protein